MKTTAKEVLLALSIVFFLTTLTQCNTKKEESSEISQEFKEKKDDLKNKINQKIDEIDK